MYGLLPRSVKDYTIVMRPLLGTCCVVVLLLMAGCAPGGTIVGPRGSPPSPQFLFTQRFPGDDGQLLATVDREVYPPHYAGLWHTHPGPGSLCVLQGVLQVEIREHVGVTLSSDQCWSELPGLPHRPVNSGEVAAVALFSLLAPAGQPRIIPAPSPAPG